MAIESAFNYGMALWGKEREPVRDPFERVVRLRDRSHVRIPNYLQCMAISHWAAGEPDVARELAQRAKRQMAAQGGREMSCWRYLEVRASDFEADTDDILRLISGDRNMLPRFMKTNSSSLSDLLSEPAVPSAGREPTPA